MELIQGTLFVDEQDCRPAGCCQVCGGAVYPPTLTCCRCERDRP